MQGLLNVSIINFISRKTKTDQNIKLKRWFVISIVITAISTICTFAIITLKVAASTLWFIWLKKQKYIYSYNWSDISIAITFHIIILISRKVKIYIYLGLAWNTYHYYPCIMIFTTGKA